MNLSSLTLFNTLMREKKDWERGFNERLNLESGKGQKNENQIWEKLASKLGFYYSTTVERNRIVCD